MSLLLSARAVILFKGPIFDRDTCPDFSEAIQVRGKRRGPPETQHNWGACLYFSLFAHPDSPSPRWA